MIQFDRFELANGLEVYVHEDHSTPMAVLNLLYKVGSRNEQPDKTGFAHLFEHLMFGGSRHIPEYDTPLQKVGGENNAFTSPDITNYHISIPSVNLETAFWLESDRMLGLSFDPKVLEVQRKVVIEEFKQRYLNQPYGDLWHKLRGAAYSTHPYRWPTIGLDIAHIEAATMQDVKDFFYTYYVPNNAILVVAGDVSTAQVKALCEKYFAPIPRGNDITQIIPAEPPQPAAKRLFVEADVPNNAWYRVYHMPGRREKGYIANDLLSDIIGRGKSSYLFQQLVKEKEWLSSFNAYVSGSYDPGLLIISGMLNEGITFEQVEEVVDPYLQTLYKHIAEEELQKVKNQAEATIHFGSVDILNRAMSLAYAAMLGDANLINTEKDEIRAVKTEDLSAAAAETLRPENSTTLQYKSIHA